MDNITFVFLRLVYVSGDRVIGPIARARVTLFELDDPPPAGDDVVVPATGVSHRENHKYTITNKSKYSPNADEVLDTLTTDETGFVEFAVSPNDVGGYLTTTATETDSRTGQVLFEGSVTEVIPEAEPDFGVTVVDASGRTITERLLVALNVCGNHVGTRENPVVVKIEQPG